MNCGIQEANAISVAAGMSAVGMVPYCHIRLLRRHCRPDFVSAFAKHPSWRSSITAAMNGATTCPLRTWKTLRISWSDHYRVTDSIMLDNVIRQLEGQRRILCACPGRTRCKFQPGSTFEIGKAAELRPGTDVTSYRRAWPGAEGGRSAGPEESARRQSMCSPQAGVGCGGALRPLTAPLSRPKSQHLQRSGQRGRVVGTCPVLRAGRSFGPVWPGGHGGLPAEIYQLDAKTIYEKARKTIVRKISNQNL